MRKVHMSTEAPMIALVRRIARALDLFADESSAAVEASAGPENLPDAPTDPAELKLGQRQRQIVKLSQLATEGGAKTAEIAAAIGYEVPNTYSTLQALARQGVVELVPDRHPQTWRLAAKYRPSGAALPYLEVAELVKEGEWTTYGDISIAVRDNTSGARAVGRAAAVLPQFPNPHRVLQQGGVVPDGWHDGDEQGPEECRRRLENEGVTFPDGVHANQERRVTWDVLRGRRDAAGSGK
jgi:alkylated DNA nucleotide flippase Atl1